MNHEKVNPGKRQVVELKSKKEETEVRNRVSVHYIYGTPPLQSKY